MMNKTLLFLTAALVLGQAAAAQDTRSLAGESAYRYDNTLQLWRHTANAAAMGIDSLRDRGRVQMSAGRHAGSYHRVQEGSAQNGLSLYTERYQHSIDNPVHVAAEQSVSTFSIDVDTGAYANVRRFLNGRTPPPCPCRDETSWSSPG